MNLSGLHLLLTYQCTFECDHCFVWGSPWQTGTMSLEKIRRILEQAKLVNSIKSIYFEGGEPFLYYPLLVYSVQMAFDMGFQVGIVSNAFWANNLEDARLWLEPFASKLCDLSISSDLFHYNEMVSQQARYASQAAKALNIPLGVISIPSPEKTKIPMGSGQLPEGESGVMYRGRAAKKLSSAAAQQPWEVFKTCPHEDLRQPGRVHVDPLGNVHICQGIVIGNMYQIPLTDICSAYNPDDHPVAGLILKGGPRMLVEHYGLAHESTYADACHLCYESRVLLRQKFPLSLAPDQVYGVY